MLLVSGQLVKFKVFECFPLILTQHVLVVPSFGKEIEELVEMAIPGLVPCAAGSLRLLELRSLHFCKALVTLLETDPGLHFGT